MFQPTMDDEFHALVQADGRIDEPILHRFYKEVSPTDDLQAIIDMCPPGATVLLMPGMHTLRDELNITKELFIFGRGKATLKRLSSLDAQCHLIASTANVYFIGVLLRKHTYQRYLDAIYLEGNRLQCRFQSCSLVGVDIDMMYSPGCDTGTIVFSHCDMKSIEGISVNRNTRCVVDHCRIAFKRHYHIIGFDIDGESQNLTIIDSELSGATHMVAVRSGSTVHIERTTFDDCAHAIVLYKNDNLQESRIVDNTFLLCGDAITIELPETEHEYTIMSKKTTSVSVWSLLACCLQKNHFGNMLEESRIRLVNNFKLRDTWLHDSDYSDDSDE